MIELKHPRRGVISVGNNYFKSSYEDIPVGDPAYEPETKYFKTDNKRLEQWEYIPANRFAFTQPANGFQLPSETELAKRHKYVKEYENLPIIRFDLVAQEPVSSADSDGILTPVTIVNYSQTFDVYIELYTQNYTDWNKSHRNLNIVGAIPRLISITELRSESDGSGGTNYYTHLEQMHTFGFFDVTFTSTHDTSETLFVKAPNPPERKKIGSYTNTSYVKYSDPPAANGYGEYWSIGETSWIMAGGGYPKFKE